MTGTVLPPLLAASAVTLTYFCCVRPTRQGHGCHMTPQQAACGTTSSSAADTQFADTAATYTDDLEIKLLREEVRLLQHELDLRRKDTVRLDKGEPR